MGNTCTPMADSCQCMAKSTTNCKVISLQLKKKKKKERKKRKRKRVPEKKKKIIKDRECKWLEKTRLVMS